MNRTEHHNEHQYQYKKIQCKYARFSINADFQPVAVLGSFNRGARGPTGGSSYRDVTVFNLSHLAGNKNSNILIIIYKYTIHNAKMNRIHYTVCPFNRVVKKQMVILAN